MEGSTNSGRESCLCTSLKPKKFYLEFRNWIFLSLPLRTIAKV